MLTVLHRSEQLRCFGLFNGCQGRVLVSNRLRRRLVRIRAGTQELTFELYGLNGDSQVPVLRLQPQTAWRARRLMQRKLLRLHPGYDQHTRRRPFSRLWSDYNRLLARGNWPLVGYDEWIERLEQPALAADPSVAQDPLHPAAAGDNRHRPRFAPGLWGQSPDANGLQISVQSLKRQFPGPFELLDPDRAAENEDPQAWLVLLQIGDRLARQALLRFTAALAQHPEALVLYADEDRISSAGRRHSPQFKPSWNPDLLYSDPHYSHCWLIRADLAQKVARRLADAAESVSLYGLVLEATAACRPEQIVHLPEVLYHRADRCGECRGDSVSATTLANFLARQGRSIEVTSRPAGGHCLHWSLPDLAPLVSVIIPTRDRSELLRGCLDSLERTAAAHLPVELLLIDNGSSDPASVAYLAELESRPGVRLLRRPGPFNYAALNNDAASLARGEVLAFLNNDVEALQPGWLATMVAQALRPEIGAVGARLLFDDGTVQHAGVLLGIGGIAGHAHKYFAAGADGYQLRLQLTHQLSAVTAAVMVVRKALFLEVGGFDAACFAVSYNDVDLCLRLMARGYRNLYCPDASLIHHESRSRGAPSSPEAMAQWQQERQSMLQRWGHLLNADPHYSPHLSLVEENFSLALRPSGSTTRPGGMLQAQHR
ncbi:MAG: glycosyltransferase family 2 protein [Cyanobacteria bacterium]|nr:glycosyltransferase family 2 protein [Cyanobacteriota bacterium]